MLLAPRNSSVKFRVDYLAVAGNANISLAVADLNDAAGELPVGGLMFFEAINGRWRALYSLYMDGADNCKETVSISKSMIAKAQDANVPQSFFPPRFYTGYDEAVAALAKYKDENMLSCASTDAQAPPAHRGSGPPPV